MKRTTTETDVTLSLSMTAAMAPSIATGIRMLDHLLSQLAFHARWSLQIKARSLDGIAHHLVEDVAIVFGQALNEQLADRSGIERYGDASVAMDDALVRCAIDLGGRAFARVNLGLERPMLEDLATDLIPHFVSSLAINARIAVHLDRLAGVDEHHITEAAFKALGRAMRAALQPDALVAIPSTKGVV